MDGIVEPLQQQPALGVREEAIEIGPLKIVPEEFIATLDDEELRLTHKEFQLLALFAAHPGRLMRRDLISREVWDGNASGRTIDIHVSRIRKQLPPDSIQTVVRVGYRFILS